jgi:hypothetical protein
VVPHLRGVVVHAAGRGLLDDGFEVEVFVLGALDQVVQVGDVGLVVLAVVVFEVSCDMCGARASMAKGSCGS